jgi:hypothetical protein
MISRLASFAVLAALFALAACTSSDKPLTIGKNRGYDIVCGGFPWTSDTDCTDRAARLCGGGDQYKILKTIDPPYAHSEYMMSLSSHEIFVQCTGQPSS